MNAVYLKFLQHSNTLGNLDLSGTISKVSFPLESVPSEMVSFKENTIGGTEGTVSTSSNSRERLTILGKNKSLFSQNLALLSTSDRIYNQLHAIYLLSQIKLNIRLLIFEIKKVYEIGGRLRLINEYMSRVQNSLPYGPQCISSSMTSTIFYDDTEGMAGRSCDQNIACIYHGFS